MDAREKAYERDYNAYLRSLVKGAKDLPADLIKYCNQVDGHGISGYKPALLFCKSRDTVYKPVQKFPKGLHEVALYEQVFDSMCTDSIILEFRKFLPKYVGLYRDLNGQGLYLGMTDLLATFERPAICDIKLGRLTYAPDAAPEKIQVGRQKYRWQEELGFSVNAMKLVDPSNGSTIHLDRNYCRSLTPDTIFAGGICTFLCGAPGDGLSRHSELPRRRATAFLGQLSRLTDWFERQRQFTFYASSLLLAYDTGCCSQTCDLVMDGVHRGHSETCSSVRTSVNLIDFTRWHRQPAPGELDANVLCGLRRLIALFGQVESCQP